MNEDELIHGVPAPIWNATKVPKIIGTCVFYIVLAIAAIILRLYARITSRAMLWWDDWFALVTVPLALLNPILELAVVPYGNGRHQIVTVETDPQKTQRAMFMLYVMILVFNLGLATFKYSFLALYIRLFSISKTLRYQCYTLGILITFWTIGSTFGIAFRCNPIEGNWKPNEGKCLPFKNIFLAQSIPTITFDILILMLPLRLVWRIQMARTARLSVTAVFLLGGIVTLISIVRLVVLLGQRSDDPPWDYVSLGLWSGAEPVTGLLCCCLPTYAPLMRRLVKSTRIGSWNSSTGSSHRDSRAKIRIPSFIALTGHSEYPTHLYWVGYKRFEKLPDTVGLTEFVHEIVGNENSPRDRNNSL